jgi:hypothetical protein
MAYRSMQKQKDKNKPADVKIVKNALKDFIRTGSTGVFNKAEKKMIRGLEKYENKR